MARLALFSIAALLGVAACGGEAVFRPLNLTIDGLSGRAERLVVRVFPASSGQTCQDVDLGVVQGLDAPYEQSWARTDAPDDRRFSLPQIEESSLTLVAHSENADGEAIQYLCEIIEYVDIESPEVTVRLSDRRRS